MTGARELNRRLGIKARYFGQVGGGTAVPTTTIERLWRTLVPGAGSGDARDILAELDREEGSRVLDPVVVATAGRSLKIVLRLPAAARILRWQVLTENGERHGGDVRAAGLPTISGGTSRRPGQVLHLDLDLPPGYHRLSLHWAGGRGRESASLILAPPRAYLPYGLGGESKAWGLAAQLYALRTSRNWGIGDFSDLGDLLEAAAALRADAVGVNPLHALFDDEPERASPYSPSSRLFLNSLYLDVTAIPDFAECAGARELVARPGFMQALQEARAAALVDYTAVACLKRDALLPLYDHFRSQHLTDQTDARGQAFRAFQRQGGAALRRFALYQALREHLTEGGQGCDWHLWPSDLRRPDTEAVNRFAAGHLERLEFFEYLQWQADLQLASAAARARSSGMEIGLYRDLAIGFDPGGADAWTSQARSGKAGAALDWSVGAPPDAWNMLGQMWGMPPLSPRALRAAAYRPFIDALRANMRHAGALRIDHILGLKRLFWIPRDGGPKDGAYVGYPFAEMLGVVALESERNRCLVVGEDLGTVPAGFSETIQARGILSYRLLYFMRGQKGAFLRPAVWPRDALAQVSTHDLPTLAGFWAGRDIETKSELSLFPDRAAEILERKNRLRLCRALTAALRRDRMPAKLKPVPAEAVHRFLARSRSRLVMVQLEDVVGALDQINMPGTVDQYPNWRRKLPLDLGDMLAAPRAKSVLAAVAEERAGRSAPASGADRASNQCNRTKLLSTYRLQLGGAVDFEAATALLPYLRELGISHLYLSPILEAQAGSSHGYDVTSYERFNPTLGSAQAFDRLAAKLRDLRMGLILDFVPNHMGIGGSRNRWWLELLEQGPAASTAEVFDVDWAPPWPELRGKILVPLLADTYERVLARGELQLRFERENGRFDIWYFDHRLPIRPEDYADVIASAMSAPDADIDRLLDRQHYRLSDWRQAATRVNYRRFFDINQLIGVRMERPSVFARCHEFIGKLIAEGKVQGLRLDHVDGLTDPGAYCRRLRRFVDHRAGADRSRRSRDRPYLAVEKILGREEPLRSDWPVDGTTGYDFIALLNEMFVDPSGARPMQRIWERFTGQPQRFEEMLRRAKGETIDAAFMADLDRLVVPFQKLAAASETAANFEADELRAALRRIAICFPVYRSYVSAGSMSAEDRRLIDRAIAAASRKVKGRRRLVYAFLKHALKGEALRRRAYVRSRAATRAAQRFQQFSAPVMAKGLEDTVFYRYLRLLSLNEVGGDPGRFGSPATTLHRRLAEQARRWPRTMLATSTHDTKRGEDSRARLNVLSEIPAEWERCVRAWARRNAASKDRVGERYAPGSSDEYFLYQVLVGAWPYELLKIGPGFRRALPSFVERMKAYLLKALREAKQETNWLDPDPEYEKACLGFLERLMDLRRSRRFLEEMAGFVHRIAPCGALNSLAQTAMKLTAPGLPDVYQGTELWDLNLVDPDNRRPVDFSARQHLFSQAKAIAALPPDARLTAWRDLAAAWPDGRIKLQLTLSLLSLRRSLPELFTGGDYQPLSLHGPAAAHVVAFRRRVGNHSLIVAIGRLFCRLGATSTGGLHRPEAWRGTKLRLSVDPGTTSTDALVGRRIVVDRHSSLDLYRLFDPLPIAVLTASD
jgi:(1->4)-alpha-D-glucan 1-alpha-D-glucosylmutase